ncbi:hypothetical protein [Roseibium sediminis]|uniref:hypothetical protein n=1 Tax=Roseibium sediminis TaxID=1775174 RepID=UPI00123D1FBB|nr:hypothetical protein [Roseibium sediminis]
MESTRKIGERALVDDTILTVTKDRCGNEKLLRELERKGLLKLYVSDMELPATGSKIKGRNSLPLTLVCADPDCRCKKEGAGGFGNGSDEAPHSYLMTDEHKALFSKILSVAGDCGRADCKQLFHHLINKRDIFSTEDKKILNFAEKLASKLGIRVVHPEELYKQLQSQIEN